MNLRLTITACPVCAVLLAGWLLWFAPSTLRAQGNGGKLDPTFGASLGLAGKVFGVLPLSDGRMMIIGDFPKGLYRLNADGSLDTSFFPGSGVSQVRAAAFQSDGKLIIWGFFYAYNGVARAGFARVNTDGSLDTTFDPGTGVVGTNGAVINSIAMQTDGKILLAGTFNKYNGTARNNLARLNADGTLDTTFDPGAGGNYGPTKIVIQPADGKMLICGPFSTYAGTARSGVARLNTNGTLDTTFNPGTGTENGAYDLALQSDGKVFITGYFNTYNGSSVTGIARLSATGALDSTFNARLAFGSQINSVLVLSSGQVVVGFSDTLLFNNVARNSAALLSTTGVLVTTFNPGTGINGSVSQIQPQPSNRLLVLSDNTPLRVNADGSADTTYKLDVAPGPNAAVLASVALSDGRTIIAGQFTQVDGVARHGIARLKVDGKLDPTFDPGLGANYVATRGIYFLARQTDGKLVIAGNFTTFNGVARNNLARLGADGALDTTYDPGSTIDYTVNFVSMQPDNKVLLAGNFDHVGGALRQGLARLTTTGAVDTTFDPGSTFTHYTSVQSMVQQADGKVVIGGSFTTVDGVARNGVARLLATGGFDSSFSPGTGAGAAGGYFEIRTLAIQTDGKILAGGYFDTFNGVDGRNSIVRLGTDGTPDAAFQPGTFSGAVSSIVLQPDGKIIVQGGLYYIGNTARNDVARLNAATGAVDTGFSIGAGSTPRSTVQSVTLQPDGKILLAGGFTGFNAAVRNYAARFDASGNLDPGFNPGIGAPKVTKLAVQPGNSVTDTTNLRVIVGGDFTTAGGRPANALARLRADGTLDPAFTAPFAAGDTVQTLARQTADNKVVTSALPAGTSPAFGADSSGRPKLQSKVKNPIVRCLPGDGSRDVDFFADAGTDGTAYSLDVQGDGKIVGGGSFSQLNSTDGRTNLGRLNANGTLDTGFSATANATVQIVLVQPDGNTLVGGLFTQVNGQARARLARLRPTDGSLDPGFSAAAGTDRPVAALKLQSDGRIVVGGSFGVVNGVARSCVARLNADGTLDTGFNAGTVSLGAGTAQVSSVDQQTDGKLIVAGLFDHVGGLVRNNVARLNTDGSVDTGYDPGAGPDAIVRSVVLQPDGKTLLGGDFTTVDAAARNAAARLLSDYDLTQYPALGQWRIINFGSPDATGKAADTAIPFGDGVSNLAKYALNLNPQSADAAPMTATGTKGLPLLGKDTSGNYLTLTFVRRQTGTAPGVSYLVEFTNALSNPAGFAVNPSASSAATTIDATWERVTVTDSLPMTTGQQPNRFVRLRVTDP